MNEMNEKLDLLVVSQPETVAEVVTLASPDCSVHTATEGGAALQVIACEAIDVVVADQAMHPLSGCELLACARRLSPRLTGLLLIDGNESEQRAASLAALGRGLAHGCILRPLCPDRFLPVLRTASQGALRRRGQSRRLKQTGQRLARQEGREAELRLLRQQALELELLALTDPLTNLPNRRAVESLLNYEVARHQRYPAPLALGVWDVDKFKSINTLHLIPGGDQALQGLARVLTASLRAADRLARLAGDEFALVLPNTDLAGTTSLAERIRNSVEQAPVSYKGKPIALTVSGGFAVAEAGKADRARLQHVAAEALAEAKAAGGNRCIVRVT
jgi:diguanylate cyclase (GGDEF)-like protein